MTKELRRVRVQNEEEFRKLLDELRTDRIPRLIEENGEPIAVILNPADYAEEGHAPKSRININKDRIMSFAGIWSDLDADKLIADIHRWRAEAPPSPDPSIYFEDEPTQDK